MAFEGLTIEEITETHINSLIGISEGRDLDFKQQTYVRTEAGNKEFLADVSAFANTVGGHIVIGVTEDGGAATGILPFTENADTEIQRLENIMLTGLQPRIIGVRIRAVPLTTGGNVLVVHIPRSWNSPHRVIAQNSNRFYMRADSRRYEPDVEGLRQLFSSGPTFTQRLRDFQYDRIAKISGGATPVPLMDKTVLVLHIIPYSAFLSSDNLEIAHLSENRNSFFPMLAANANWRINLDGLVLYTGTQSPYPAYTQVWRNGCVEAVRCPIVRQDGNDRTVRLPALAGYLIRGCRNYLAALRTLGISAPLGIFVTMIGVNNAHLFLSPNHFDEENTFDRDILLLSEIIIDSYPPDDRNVPIMLKPIFDQIAQAGGYEESPNFDVNGNIAR